MSGYFVGNIDKTCVDIDTEHNSLHYTYIRVAVSEISNKRYYSICLHNSPGEQITGDCCQISYKTAYYTLLIINLAVVRFSI